MSCRERERKREREREREVLLREDPTKTSTHPPTHEYKCGAGKNKDKHLKVGPAVHYFNSLGKQLSDKYKNVNDKTKYFFTWGFILIAHGRGVYRPGGGCVHVSAMAAEICDGGRDP